MRIQVVEYDANDLGVGIGGDDVPHAVREFDLGAPFHDQDIAPAPLGFADHHQIAHAVALILGVLTRRLAGFSRQRFAHFPNQLLRTFVEAHHRAGRVIANVNNPEKLGSSPQRRKGREGSQRKSKRYANGAYLL